MTNIDRALVEAVKDLVPLDVTGHVRRCDYPDCDCFTLPARFAAAVDAARAEGEKQGAARVREAVEARGPAVLAHWGVKSRHGEWSDAEVQRHAIRDVLRAASPEAASPSPSTATPHAGGEVSHGVHRAAAERVVAALGEQGEET